MMSNQQQQHISTKYAVLRQTTEPNAIKPVHTKKRRPCSSATRRSSNADSDFPRPFILSFDVDEKPY